MVYIATDCPDDLQPLTTDLVSFERPAKETQSPCPRILAHGSTWFVGSKSGCSCTFRHLGKGAEELGFDEPQEWYPEEPDAVEATSRLFGILKSIVDRGFQVDLMDCWSGDEDNDATTMDVSLSEVSGKRFRMFEGHLFRLRP